MNKWHTFEHSGFAGIGNGDNDILTILKLSYHNLTPSLKNCFSYCALFPKDYRLKRKELISLWIAQGYIVSLDRDQSIEDAAEEHFLILVRRCFFHDVEKDKYGDIECVKMHDLMHDVAREVGKEEIGVVSSNTTELGDKIRHVYFARGAFSQSYSFKSKIRSLISEGSMSYDRMVSVDQVDAQIDSWIGLRVLCLQSTGIKRFDSICKLMHLRHLDLSVNHELKALPDSITRLHNLQTLDLHRCTKLRELPKDFSKLVNLRYLDLSQCDELSGLPSGMGQLTSLRHFDFSDCYKLTSMPSGIGKLTYLRVLPLFVVGMEKRVSTEEQCMGELKDLKALTNLKGGIEIKIGIFYKNDGGGGGYLKGLKYLTQVEIRFVYSAEDEIDGCLEWKDVLEKLEPPSNLKGFILSGYKGMTIPRWGRVEDNWALSLPHLVKIDLLGCVNLEQIPSLSKLRNLKSLILEYLHKLEYMENTSSNNAKDGEDLTVFFPSLETLTLWNLSSLKGWWREEELVEDDDDDGRILRSSFRFPRLSKLMIYNCPKLTSFPSCGSIEDLGLDEVGSN
ncbi:putative disease resistance protein RGA3 [Chenopodium quinoa]|uniref:putative disease resistance protein RGA3 n=1 Tax=Chenopodium quinoa TaxID=63459 RepID=UPI000B77DDAE|nr:putative disease resistance protein RGA3 [Chenopodium quinoa]